MSRGRFIKVRVSDNELADIRARAMETGMTVSDFMRFRMMNYRLRQTSADKERLRHLARIGSNINQLARWANSRKAAAPALEVALWLSRLVDGVNRVADEPKPEEGDHAD
jgi:hypothetical protein